MLSIFQWQPMTDVLTTRYSSAKEHNRIPKKIQEKRK
jgi:hypothetical protein